MSEAEKRIEDEEEEFVESKYQPPKEVSLSEILNKDYDDAALNKYKQQLIGGAANVILEPSDPRRVLMKRAILIPDGHPEIVIDLNGNLDTLKERVITLKEGSEYRVKLQFHVQRDIASGLKYTQAVYKGPLKTDKTIYMLGSRAPKPELQEYLSEKETTPSGMLARGKYTVKTTISDDDKNVYLKCEWILEIAKEWK